jgi:hypothetical protein
MKICEEIEFSCTLGSNGCLYGLASVPLGEGSPVPIGWPPQPVWMLRKSLTGNPARGLLVLPTELYPAQRYCTVACHDGNATVNNGFRI